MGIPWGSLMASLRERQLQIAQEKMRQDQQKAAMIRNIVSLVGMAAGGLAGAGAFGGAAAAGGTTGAGAAATGGAIGSTITPALSTGIPASMTAEITSGLGAGAAASVPSMAKVAGATGGGGGTGWLSNLLGMQNGGNLGSALTGMSLGGSLGNLLGGAATGDLSINDAYQGLGLAADVYGKMEVSKRSSEIDSRTMAAAGYFAVTDGTTEQVGDQWLNGKIYRPKNSGNIEWLIDPTTGKQTYKGRGTPPSWLVDKANQSGQRDTELGADFSDVLQTGAGTGTAAGTGTRQVVFEGQTKSGRSYRRYSDGSIEWL